MPSKLDNSSPTPDALRDLSEEQTERLTAVLDDYLARLESGDAPDLQELLHNNADIEAPLQLYIGKLGDLHNFAAGFSPHLAGTEDDEQESGDSFDPVPVVNALVSDDTDPGTDGVSSGSTISPEVTDSKLPIEPVAVQPTNDSRQRVPTRVLTGDIDPAESPTVRRLGDFELLRVIGRGGMGIVYEAQQLSLRRRVALKLLPLISVLDARQIARFKNEAQAAANLQHPNIVPVHAVGNYQGVHYYAMRYIDGHALDAIIAALRHKKAAAQTNVQTAEPTANDPAESTPANHATANPSTADAKAAEDWTVPPAYQMVVRIGIQAASGLAAAHEDGIIHRDIKPSNLMLDKKGKLWITDFGLARRMTDHSLTATGDVMGTLRYMSPEQSKGQTALVDGRSDVYSLGATLYELLTLEPAITGESSPAMLRAIEQQMPIPLKQHRPDLPRDLITVIEKAMAKSREDRYETAQDFADDLTRVLEGKPTLAKPLTWLERGIKWIQRNERLVRISAALAFTAFLFFGVGLAILLRVSSDKVAAQREARQRVGDLRSQSLAFLSLTKDLEGIPGTESIRRLAYTRLLDNFRGLVNYVRLLDNSRTELATALSYMGELQCEMQDWVAARESLSEAKQLLQAQYISDPKRVEYRLQFAKCMTSLGLVESQTGHVEVADKLGQQALEMFDGLIQSHPDSSSMHYDRAKAANSLAMLWIRIGKQTEAAELLGSTKALLEKSIAEWPLAAELKEVLFYVDTNLASVTTPTARAIALYQSAVDTQTQICKIDNRVRPSADLALAFTNLGRAYARNDEHAAALAAYAKAQEINDLIRQLAPNNIEFLRNASINLNNLAMAQRRTGDNQAAEKQFREAIAILEKICKASPANAELQHELGGAYNNLANLLEKTGRMDEVDETYRLAIEHQRNAYSQAANIATYRVFLDNHLLNYSRWLTATRRCEAALAIVEQRQALWPEDHPQQVVIASQLADAALEFAKDKRSQAEADRYAQAAKRALKLAQEAGLSVQSILKQDPSSSLAKLKSLTESARP